MTEFTRVKIEDIRKPFSSLALETPNAFGNGPNLVTSNRPNEYSNVTCRFLELPVEVRNRIYSHLLDTGIAPLKRNSGFRPYDEGTKTTILRSPWELGPSILRVNRQIHAEANHLFHSKNLWIRVTIRTKDVVLARLFMSRIVASFAYIGALPSKVAACENHVMDVSISIFEGKDEYCQFMMPASSLGQFTFLLSDRSNTGKSDTIACTALNIDLHHSYDYNEDTIQKILLEPWRALVGIPEVMISSITGPSSYTSKLRQDMQNKTFDADAFLKGLNRIIEEGNREFETGMLDQCRISYVDVVTLVTNAYRDVEDGSRGDLLSMPDVFSQSVARIYFDAIIALAMTEVNIDDDLERAWKWSNEAVGMADARENWYWLGQQHAPFTDVYWFTDTDRAKALFCRGTASLVQGQYTAACVDFEQAQLMNPQDEGIGQTLESARRRLANES